MTLSQSKSSPPWGISLLREQTAMLVFFLIIVKLSLVNAVEAKETNPLKSDTYCLDRYEEEWAILINTKGEITVLPKEHLPRLAMEGDILQVQIDKAGNLVDVRIDWEATRDARKRIRAKIRSLLQEDDTQSIPAETHQSQ